MKKSLKIIFISIFAALTGIALVSCRHKNKDKAVNNQENTQQNNQDQKQDGNGKEGKGGQTTPVEPTPAPQKDQAEKENGKENEEGKGGQTTPVEPTPAPQDENKEQSQADQAEKQQNQPETKKEVTGIDISKMYYQKLWLNKFNELKEEILSHDITDFDKKYLFVLISKAIKNIKEEKQTFDQAYKEVYKQLVKKVAENSKKQNNELKKENEKLQADEAPSEETTNNGKQTVPSTNPSEEPKLNGEHETTNQTGDADATVVQPQPGNTDGSTSETSPSENIAGNAETSPEVSSEEKQSDEAVASPSNGESSTPSSGESSTPSSSESSTTSPSPSNTEVSTPAENAKEEKYLLEAPIKENWDPQTGYITYTFTTSNEIYEYYKTKLLVLKITNPHFEVGNNLFEAAKFNVGNIETNLDPKKRNGGNVTFEISTQYYFRPDTAPESKYSLVGIYEIGKNDKNILKNQSKGVDIKFNK